MQRRFCPACGHVNRKVPGTAHRTCPTCRETDWVNPAPAIGIALMRGGSVLLSRRARAPKKGQWDLVGGFLEANETPDEAARREILEETGCAAGRIRLRDVLPGTYAGRPTLNFLAQGTLRGQPRAQDDSLELRWFALQDLPPMAWPHEAAFMARLRRRR